MLSTSVKSARRVGVMMMNMGGPSNVDGVPNFLNNLFSDPDIIDLGGGLPQDMLAKVVTARRSATIADQYTQIGGGSPIGKWTQMQGDGMCERLNASQLPDGTALDHTAGHEFSHYTAFRYVPPYSEDALRAMVDDGIEHCVAFSQYPQWSCTTAGSSVNELWRAWEVVKADTGAEMKFSVIDRWHQDPYYVEAVANRVLEGLADADDTWEGDPEEQPVLMFSAHSLPQKVVAKGDSYAPEIGATVSSVMARVTEKLGTTPPPHILCWQSKVGYLPWLQPSTEDVIKKLGDKQHKRLVVVPVAFTSDHIETLFEIDIEYKELAHEHGVEQFLRAPSLNDEPCIFDAQAHVVNDHLGRLQDESHGKPHFSWQFPLRCVGCEKESCRQVVDPIVPYQGRRD